MVSSKKAKLKRTRKRNSKKTKVKRKAHKNYSNKMTYKKTRKRNKKTKKKRKNKNNKTVNQKLNRNQNNQLSYQFGGFLPNNLINHLYKLSESSSSIVPLIEDSIFKAENLDPNSFFGNSAENFKEGFKNLQQHYRYVNETELQESINMKNIAMMSSHNTEITRVQFNPLGTKKFSGEKYTHLLDKIPSDYGRIDQDPIFRFIKEYCMNGIGCIELDLIDYETTIFVTHKVLHKVNLSAINLKNLLTQIINILKEVKCILVINFDNTQLGKNQYNEIFKNLLVDTFSNKTEFLLDGSIQDTDLKTVLQKITNGKIVFRMERALFMNDQLKDNTIMIKLGLNEGKKLKHLIKGENTKTLTNADDIKNWGYYDSKINPITISRTYPSSTNKNYPILYCMYHGINIPAENFQTYNENLAIYLALFSGIPFYYYPPVKRKNLSSFKNIEESRGLRPIPINIEATELGQNIKCFAFKYKEDSDSIGKVQINLEHLYENIDINDINVINITKTETTPLYFPVLLFTFTDTKSGKIYHSAVRLDGVPYEQLSIKELVFFPKDDYVYLKHKNIPDPRFVKKNININYLEESII